MSLKNQEGVYVLKLRERISKGENRTTEFKREVPVSLKNILKTIIAFANDAGGDIFIGIDNEKQVNGIKEDTLVLEEKISNTVHDAISPIPVIFYRVLNIESKQIFNIKVLSGIEKPYHFKRDGVENSAYIRVGSTNKKSDLYMIDEMRRQNLNLSYDEKICYSINCENLSKQLIRKFVDKYGDISKEPIDILIRDKYVIKTNGNCYPTIGSVLLFSEKLPPEFEYASIIISKYSGNIRANLISSVQIKTGLLEAIPIVINDLKNTLWTKISITIIERKDNLEIPELAIREAVINSICHRDYSIAGSSTKIDIFNDRLEILSPGNLPIGIALEDLGEGASEIRNKVIAKIFRRFGYIEKLGTGITRMISECKNAGIPIPFFEEIGRYFRVTFYKNKIEINDFEEKIIIEIKVVKEIKAKDLALKLNVHPNTVLKHLKEMMTKNLILKIGNGPNVRYRIKM